MQSGEMIFSKALFVIWMGLGVQIERAERFNNGTLCHFSVPQSSFARGAQGKEMAGKHLASRFKSTLETMGLKFTDCQYRIREEHWTEEDGKCAEDAMRENLSNLDLFGE